MRGKEGLACLVAEAKGKGFSKVLTGKGWQRLEDWRPYGSCLSQIDFASWYIFSDHIRESAESDMIPGTAYGVWQLGQ